MKKVNKKCSLVGCILFMVLFLTGCGSKLISNVSHISQLGEKHHDAVCVSGDRYVHNTLSEERQLVYDQMLDAIMNMEENVRLSTADKSDIQTCYNAICADYGEIFWVESCSYREISMLGKPFEVGFTVNYAYTPEEVADYRAQMQPQIDAYVDRLSTCESDYEKTEVLYRKLIREVAYDMEADNNQNILSVFLGKKTVCQGYACATQYLLQQVGIPCAIITGIAQGQPHAWNLVQLDGDFYFMDVTWGNMDYKGLTDDAAETVLGGINYGYLNITSEELLKNHKPQVDFPISVCNSTENNYYVKKKLYFDNWDADAVGAKLARAYDREKDSISVKFASRQLLAQAKQYLIDEQHIMDFCEGISQIYYVMDTDLNILTLYF